MTAKRTSRLSRRPAIVAGLFSLGLAAGCSSASEGASAASSEAAALSAVTPHPVRNACDQTNGIGRFHAFCLAQVVTDLPRGYTPSFGAAPDLTVRTDHQTTDVAYGPSDFQSAYAIPAGGKGVTVAIVDAQDDPNAESDLAVFRAKYGLPACTTANGCFKKVAYDGTANLPGADAGWGTEISLDLDAVSAACPQCNILLVEAEEANPPAGTTATRSPLAVDTAVKLGAKYISNSYGITETTNANEGILKADAVSESTHYIHAGVAIFASSGDSGFAAWPNNTGSGAGANFPADIPQVFAVGGTRLVKSTAQSRGWSESVWGSTTDANGGGNSGCSHFFAKPTYQKSTACTRPRDRGPLGRRGSGERHEHLRHVLRPNAQNTGWEVVGGTSLASPLTAAIFAASGLEGVDPSFVYTNEADFNDVTTGENGTCKEKSLCNGVTGYDGPTGIGTPDGDKIEGGGVDGGAPGDGGTSSDGGAKDGGGSRDGGGSKDGGGSADAGPVDSGPEDAGPAVTWTTIYDEAFAPGTPGHCGNSGCHGTLQAGFLCGKTASSCLAGMKKKGLLSTKAPRTSILGATASSPLRWVHTGGPMPLDNKTAEPKLGADIEAWVKAGAPGIE